MTLTLLAAMISLASPYSTAKVSTYGAVLTSWKPNDSSEVMAMPKEYESWGRGSEIPGGFPTSWPWAPFRGPETAAVHFISRCFDWRVKRQSGDCVILELNDNAETRRIWNHKFHLEMEYRIGKSLEFDFRVTNTDSESFTCTEEMHPYFRVGDTAKCRVVGTDGLNYFVRTQPQFGYSRKWNGDLRPREVFTKVLPGHLFDVKNKSAPNVYQIVDDELGRVIEVEYLNYPKLVIWNSGPDFRVVNLCDDPDFGKKFVCVMGGWMYDYDCAYTLKPGETHVASAKVRVKGGKQ